MDSVSPLLPIRREDRGRAPIIIPPKIEKFPASPGDRYFFLPFGNSVSTFDEFFAYFELERKSLKLKFEDFVIVKWNFRVDGRYICVMRFNRKGVKKYHPGGR